MQKWRDVPGQYRTFENKSLEDTAVITVLPVAVKSLKSLDSTVVLERAVRLPTSARVQPDGLGRTATSQCREERF